MVFFSLAGIAEEGEEERGEGGAAEYPVKRDGELLCCTVQIILIYQNGHDLMKLFLYDP